MRSTLAGACVALALLVSPAGAASERAGLDPDRNASFAFLYLDSNEDQASGGHAAVRIDDDVFHFQYEDGLLRMQRDDWSDFQFSYRGLQNRSIHLTRVAISRDTHRRLRAAFLRRHLTQTHQIDRLLDARADRELVDTLAGAAPVSVSLPGLGFFEPPGHATGPKQTANRSQLRRAIEARYGPGSLVAQRLRAQARLESLEVVPLEARASDFEPGLLPRPAYAFHERYADSVAAIRALEVLLRDVPLGANALLPDSLASELDLSAEERAVLERSAVELEVRLVALAAASRPDWGHAMLLGMARLESIETSLRSGQWRLLDVLADDATRLEIGPNTRSLLPLLDEEARQQWLAARADWTQSRSWDERSFAKLEYAAARQSELQLALAGARELRIHRDQRVPQGMGRLDPAPVPDAVRANPVRPRMETEAAARAIDGYGRAALGYRLVTRNCVSELFATIDEAMAKAVEDRGQEARPSAIGDELALRLGGVVDASPIPFISSLQVRRHWRIAATLELPSLRRQRASELYARDPSPWLLLRESNTWTSTLYRPSDRDSYFLFFTDEMPALRPLQGMANLVAGFSRAAVGFLSLPFDRGRGLSAGLRGAMFSLPELAFFNIRKGTNDWLPHELRPAH